MATRKKAGQETQTGSEKALHTAAKAIGSAIGTIAAKTGIAHGEAPSKKRAKLVKKDKRRLPRKEKKQAKKALEAKGPQAS